MVAIPVAMDQPGVGARIAWTGTGKTIPVAELTAKRLGTAIGEVLANERYRAQAKGMQRQIASTRGVERAAELIDSASRKATKVYADPLRMGSHNRGKTA